MADDPEIVGHGEIEPLHLAGCSHIPAPIMAAPTRPQGCGSAVVMKTVQLYHAAGEAFVAIQAAAAFLAC